MSNLKTSKAHNINCDELVFDTNNDAKNSHFNIRTTGAVGENDVEFKTCNVKVSDGSLAVDSVKDLAGNEVFNFSGSNHIIKDTAGDPILTIGDSTIDFHSATANNLTLGTGALTTNSISSQNYTGETLEHELDTIATNITAKLGKDGQTANKILTTSSGGVIQFTQPLSKLTDIATNSTAIGTIANLDTSASNLTEAVNEIHTETNTNTSNISTNTSNISTNTSNISTNTSNISTNTSNISSNTGNVASALSSISTLNGIAVKLDETQTLTNKTLTAPIISTISNSSATLTLPTTTGTLALNSAVTTNATNIASNDSDITTLTNGKLNLSGGTLTGGLVGTTAQFTGFQGGTIFAGSSTGTGSNFQIDDAPLGGSTESFVINYNVAFTPDAYYVGTTTGTPMRLGTNNSTRLRLESGGDVVVDSGVLKVGDVVIDETNEINSSSGLFINDDVSSDVRLVNGGGEVGIGGNASFPLHVHGGQDQGTTTFTRISPEHKVSAGGANVYVVAARTTTNPTSIAGADSDGKIGIECDDCSVKAHYYFFNSDRRIKKDITDLSDNESLAIIRDISCVKYKYIDNVKRGKDWTYGFIANQVAEVFPNAVRTMYACVPDEMRDISDSDWSGNKILVPDLSGSRYKLYYGNGDKERHDTFDYVDGGFELDKKYSQVYLYGSEVNDFHVLDKSKIYAVLTSAVQELDKKVVVLETENISLKERVEVLEKKLADEETKTAYFQMRIDKLYSHLNL